MVSYAFFDFDGTLISQDSFLILLKESLKRQPWRLLPLLLFSPILFFTGIFKLDKTLAKSLILWSMTIFLGKLKAIQFLKNTLPEKYPQIWFQQALEHLEALKKQNIEVVIVSASGQIWVRSYLKNKFQKNRLIIGSKLQFFCGGVILKSKNCYHEEKIKRIQALLGEDILWHSAWSDHIADLPMLKKASLRYIVCPKKSHLKIFQKELNNKFTLLNWTTWS